MTQDAPKSNLISTDRLVLSSSFIDQDWLLNNSIRTQHIYLPDDPVDDEDAANKAYVDSKIASADTLAELEDVTLASLADNDLLSYDSTDERWENQSAAEAGLATAGHNHDHGVLTGLTDDDHTQYHNNTRGDARYYTETELDAGQLDTRYYTETESDSRFVNVTGAEDIAGIKTFKDDVNIDDGEFLTFGDSAATTKRTQLDTGYYWETYWA